MPLLLWSQIAILLCSCSAFASPLEGLFDGEDVLAIELRGPLRATMNDTRNRDSREFVLTTGEREFALTASLRGNSRVRACRFRPLRLDFSASDTADSIFEGQGELKLVTHCRDSDAYEQNVLEEYAAYRIFALLSDVALRTRLLKIRYIDTEKATAEPVTRFGFLIESIDEKFGIAAIEARKQDILNLVAALQEASAKQLAWRANYLQEYFDASEDADELAGAFRSRCL